MAQTLPPPRVLVVDDNALTLEFFRHALNTLGVDVVAANSGHAALALCAQETFDLLLLDARMPSLSGAETLARLRALIEPPQRAVALATTASTDTAAHAALRGAGFAAVLVKPLDRVALKTVLDRYLPAAAQRLRMPDAEADFDDAQALAAAGGDGGIVASLRALFLHELEMLPVELARMSERRDAAALTERLHRLDASAGFCGVPALIHAGSLLRRELATTSWPEAAIAQFAALCKRIGARLAAEAALSERRPASAVTKVPTR